MKGEMVLLKIVNLPSSAALTTNGYVIGCWGVEMGWMTAEKGWFFVKSFAFCGYSDTKSYDP